MPVCLIDRLDWEEGGEHTAEGRATMSDHTFYIKGGVQIQSIPRVCTLAE